MELSSRNNAAQSNNNNTNGSDEYTSLLDSIDPLDIDEQQKIIDGLRAELDEQNKSSRRQFGILYLIVAIILFTCLGTSYLKPFEMSHQHVFEFMVPHIYFNIYYFCMCVIFILGGYSFLYGLNMISKIIKIIAIITCTLLTLIWIGIFIQLGVTEPSLYWLPVLPILSLIVAWYFDKDYNELFHDIQHLDTLKYDYKKA
jgi:hypothetical protein